MLPPDNGLLINIHYNDKCYDSNNGLYVFSKGTERIQAAF